MAPTRIALGVALLLTHGSLAATRCGDGAGDLAAVATARDAIAETCDCSGAASPRDYATCARGVIVQRVADSMLPSVCARGVRSCTRRSTCGRPGTVACCRGGTKPKCKITTPERCAASGRCVATQASCCDACDIFGCVTTTT